MIVFKISSLRYAPIIFTIFSSLAYAQHYAIYGVHDGVDAYSGARPLRKNVYDLQKDPYAFSLFIQAVGAMQNRSDPLISYFNISGIHGRPYIPWDNVTAPVVYDTGYCAHSSVLFPSWHRPFLALFEQEMHAQAQAIAKKYRSYSDKWQNAAKYLRLPYWDWAQNCTIPDLLSQPTVSIITPSGLSPSYSNPLYTYKFPPMDPVLYPEALARTGTTKRNPRANEALKKLDLTGAMYNALVHITDYPSFATQAVSGASLEAIHSEVHVAIGGNYGHMSSVPYAAFDPIFWLHHANCDRLLSIYQAINPTSYIPSSGYPDDSYTFTQGPQTDYPNTPLTPFSLSPSGTLWASDSARYLSAFGYSYPEISDWNQSPSQLTQNVTYQVNALYGTSSNNRYLRSRHSLSPAKEWFVDISVDLYELDTQFIIWIFLGDPPADSGSWRYSDALVGSLVVLTPAGVRRAKGEIFSYGEVALYDALNRAGLLYQDDAAIIDYLTKNLQWRVEKGDGTTVDPKTCASLKVEVYDEVVYPAEDDYHFPTYGNRTIHLEITSGKEQGY